MPRRIPEETLKATVEVVRRYPDGATARQIAESLRGDLPLRTLQYRLKALVEDGRLTMEGSRRATRYRAPNVANVSVEFVSGTPEVSVKPEALPPLSTAGAQIRDYVRQPREARQPVGYDPDFLDGYRPNETFYLSLEEREQIRAIGTPGIAEQPAGTYAQRLLERLLIHLSWNSSRLEGNTYSLLETHQLIEASEETEGKDREETQMILNHKEAVQLLIEFAADIGFNRYTILNLHAALADGLLPDPAAPGRLRQRVDTRIHGSVFVPLQVPQQIEERFDQILSTAAAIEDPFEQAFFAMVQLPYLQPFDDVNKRVSRLAANIPLIKANLAPLSFDDLPRDVYIEAVLGVYELKRTELLRDVFLWAYRRSAAHYDAMRQSLGEPDPFRIKHRTALRAVIGDVVRRCMEQRQASIHIRDWTVGHISAPDREQFRHLAEQELLSLHAGNFARYRVTPNEFDAWQRRWTARTMPGSAGPA